MSTIRISIFFHNRLLRDSIARILGKKAEFEVVAAQNCDPMRPVNVAEPAVDVLLLDSLEYLCAPELSAASLFSNVLPRRVLLAMEDEPAHFLRAVRKGAWGYVLQDASAVDVVAAVRSVADGQAVCPPRYTRVLFEYIATQTDEMPSGRRRSRWGLTRREQQVIPLIKRGLSNKEIANHFHLSEQTVKNHIHRILRKTGASDRLSIAEACQELESTPSTERSTESKYPVRSNTLPARV